MDDSRHNIQDCERTPHDSTVWNEDKYLYLKCLSKDEKDELAQDAIQCIYQCNFEQDISLFHSQMQIAVAALVFQLRCRESLQSKR